MDALATADAFLFEGFRLDRRGLFRRDPNGCFVPVSLGSRALEVLGILIAHRGGLVSRDEIMNAVWPGTVVEDSNLPVQVAALRRVLDDRRADGSCIQNVPGRGYRFLLPVTQVEASARPITSRPGGDRAESPVAENREPQNPSRPRQFERDPPAAPSREPVWFRRAIAATLAGVACLLAAVVAASNWHLPWSNKARPVPRLSIVVLPFADLSADRNQQYFADGVTEDLTTDLSRMAGTLVISADNALTYKNKPESAKQIGRELGVRYVVEGSVERAGNRVRVSAQLIDAGSDTHLWAERFDREISDLFELQSEITGRVAFTLNLALIAAEAGRPVEHPDALDYIFRGREFFFGRPPSHNNYRMAIGLYEHALARAPQSADAKTFLAGALVNDVISFRPESSMADLARAEKLIDEALAASPKIPWAHYVKGTVLRVKEQWRDAAGEFEEAMALNRNMIGAFQGLGWCKLFTGALDEVIPLAGEAIRIGPRDPTIGFRYLMIGEVHELQARPDEAIVWFEKARGTISAVAGLRAHLASAYALVGNSDRAEAELAEARRLNPRLFSSMAQVKASGTWGVPKVRAMFENTYFAGLRKAGMPEE